jgi:beta-galactosidase
VTVKSVIVDASANIVQTVSTPATLAGKSGGTVIQDVTMTSPHLWDGLNDPYLYSVYVEIHEGSDTGPVRDLIPVQPLGLRYYGLDPNQGFELNGHYLDLHGVNRHQDRLNKGWAISESDQDQDMSLIKEIGASAVRLAHYQHAQHFYSLADQNGLVVWAEIPVVNGVGSQAFSINARQQLTELIRQNYNHPAIIFWSIANEVLASSGPDPNPLLTELNALAKQEDPYRITTLAHCCGSDTDPTTNRTDTLGYNKYFGWYEGSYDSFGPWADATHNGSPGRPFSISEYGAGASIFLHAQDPPLSLSNHTEEYQALFHEGQSDRRRYQRSKRQGTGHLRSRDPEGRLLLV